MNNYLRVLSRLQAPLFISEDKLALLTENVILPILLSGKAFESTGAYAAQRDTVETKGKIGLIDVYDSLVSRNGAGESGFTSYEGIKASAIDALNQGVTKIGFLIGSPGGEASSLFSLTDFIKSIPEVYGVETFAFTDSSATSAAYAIAASTQRIYSTKTATTGSIGAIISLVDVTGADKENGVKYTILRSKPKKALYNPHEEVSSEVIEKTKSMLAILDNEFNLKVSSYRPNLSVDKILSLQADSFLGEEALNLGLVDFLVNSIEEVLDIESKDKEVPSNTSFSSTNRGRTMASLEELNSLVKTLETEKAALKDSVTGLVQEAITKERTRCTDIIKAGLELKVSNDQIVKRVSMGSSKEDALDIFTTFAEAYASASAVNTATTVQSTVDTGSKKQVNMVEVDGVSLDTSAILNFAKGVK